MPETILTITRGRQVRRVALEPRGQIIGRNEKCDIVIQTLRVSRRHARIFRDPFGRWLIQDLGSRNGIKADGERVNVCALQVGREVAVGPFVLSVSGEEVGQIAQDPSVTRTTTTLTADAPGTEVVRLSSEGRARLSRARLKRLNGIADLLAGLTRPAMLYPQLCRCVARAPGSAALVLRLIADEHLPQIMASHIGEAEPGQWSDEGASVPLSRRVLQAVRSGRQAVMATSQEGGDVGLTIVDDTKPRAVFCGPISEGENTFDVLYVDMPADQAMPDMFDFLLAVARQAGLARKSVLLAQAQAEHQALERQLATARGIQARLTPSEFADIQGVDVAVHYEPAMWVGGDYCDVWTMDDGRLIFTVADVAGKGLPAALAMANLQAALRATLAFSSDLAEVLSKVNTLIVRNLPERMFVTLFLGLLSPGDGRLQYVNAGHLQPMVIAGGKVSPLAKPSDHPLGITEGTFQTAEQKLDPATSLVLVTDGITESASPKGDLFGQQRLTEVLEGLASASASAKELVGSVVTATAEFRDSGAQQDDITVLALVIGGTPERK